MGIISEAINKLNNLKEDWDTDEEEKIIDAELKERNLANTFIFNGKKVWAGLIDAYGKIIATYDIRELVKADFNAFAFMKEDDYNKYENGIYFFFFVENDGSILFDDTSIEFMSKGLIEKLTKSIVDQITLTKPIEPEPTHVFIRLTAGDYQDNEIDYEDTPDWVKDLMNYMSVKIEEFSEQKNLEICSTDFDDAPHRIKWEIK